MSDTPQNPSHGIFREVYNALPEWLRTVVAISLTIPLTLAIGGAMLQINVGSLIEDSLRKTRVQTVDIVSDILDKRISRLETKVDGIISAQTLLSLRQQELERRIAQSEFGLGLPRMSLPSPQRR